MAATISPPKNIVLEAISAQLENIPYVGKFLANIIRNPTGAFIVLSLVFLIFLYPLMVAYLAAFWINKGTLLGARDLYVDEVRLAFKVRETADAATTESFKRLDYFIPIEFTRPARDAKSVKLPVAKNQKLELRIAAGKVFSTNPEKCGIPPSLLGEGAALLEVFINDMSVGFVRTNEQRAIVITKETWEPMKGESVDSTMPLTFRPTPDLAVACDELQVHVEASVLVFKDMYKP